MSYRTIQGDYQVHSTLHDVVNNVILPNTGVSEKQFWSGLVKALQIYQPKNEALLRKRDAIQAQIDAYHLERKGQVLDQGAYTAFLAQIGYLVPTGPAFQVDVSNVDHEIKDVPGPQLVVPVDNARYALNAANARWGSLMDAFYGTDAGPSEANGCERGSSYNPKRGAAVFEYAQKFLDTHFPLARGAKYSDVVEYSVSQEGSGSRLLCKLKNGQVVGLDTDSKFVGYNVSASDKTTLSSVLLMNNGLHVEIVIDRKGNVGKGHPAGIQDIVLESAMSAIADCEDSVAAVDAEDKARVYSNWCGLMKGNLSEKFQKGNQTLTRSLRPDRTFISAKDPKGKAYTLGGRACMLVRNVGLHVYTDAILTPVKQGSREVPEGIVDAFVTALAALHDLAPESVTGKPRNLVNSKKGSMYVVKPKMHGPEEVKFSVDVFAMVEKVLGMKPNTIKIGVMDEERRTTVNLLECIRAAKNRVIFINTGFLDRTGDEIHTSFMAGPVLPKDLIKKAVWRNAYEDWNVDIGGACGVAQVGKGMWAAPDSMGDMLRTKGEHPRAGANTAWVPSPTAATLHAIHYHEVNVLATQRAIVAAGPRAKLSDILTPPLLGNVKLSPEEIQFELENNCQGILGYVVRWIEMGVGCSKVPDLHDVGLMEDRATLRISSQHIANWLYHGLVTKEQVEKAFEKMAIIVDKQNKGDKAYVPMSPSYNNLAYKCALEMVFAGQVCPNGLTEGTLAVFRRAEKALKGKSSSKL